MIEEYEDPRRGAGDGQGRAMPDTGVHVNGGSFTGPVAMGSHGQAVQYNQSQAGDDDLARFEELLRQIEAGLRELGGAHTEDALDDLGRVQDELGHRKPEWARISELLSRVGAVVAPVSSLVELANHAKELITVIAH
jgi:ABC-type transporter Mla subunit MlaD